MVMINENKLRKLVQEELSKTEIKNMIDSQLNKFIDRKEFEDKVYETIANTFEKFFKMMYNKRGFWKNDIKRN